MGTQRVSLPQMSPVLIFWMTLSTHIFPMQRSSRVLRIFSTRQISLIVNYRNDRNKLNLSQFEPKCSANLTAFIGPIWNSRSEKCPESTHDASSKRAYKISFPRLLLDLTSVFKPNLRTSGDLISRACAHAEVGVILNRIVEYALMDWIQIKPRLCKARLEYFVSVSRCWPKSIYLLVFPVYLLTVCRSKGRFF